MSLVVVRCEVCGEHAHCYSISFPKKDVLRCETCGRVWGSEIETVDFCSWACMEKWLDDRRRKTVTVKKKRSK